MNVHIGHGCPYKVWISSDIHTLGSECPQIVRISSEGWYVLIRHGCPNVSIRKDVLAGCQYETRMAICCYGDVAFFTILVF